MSSLWKECVLDASMGCADGYFTFCPIEGDIDGEFSVVTGMNHIGALPPDGLRLVAIVHPDGQEAVERFCEQHGEALEVLRREKERKV